ncbi:hypothetical protein AQUCO_00200325v1 [Aquilegia coerulea]|uniref:Uncharacterized protein n=1 Tax=Aquilegia coerulea TaxID=218851 RepID=A0A2G5F2S0_AQUCA|nr:hypothetical protein AQUCO_00200325v1 [Aquilegia coerulea]
MKIERRRRDVLEAAMMEIKLGKRRDVWKKRCVRGTSKLRFFPSSSSSTLEQLFNNQREREREMGLFTHTLAGGGLMLIGSWEVFMSSYATLHSSSPSSSSSTPPSKIRKNHLFTSIKFLAIAVLSFCFIVDSLISLEDAHFNKDQVGFALQLEITSISSLFFLYSVFGLLFNFTNLVPLPSSILNLIVLFAFGQEFLHFYGQRKDSDGLENRYYDLLLVPITACIFTTVIDMGGYKSYLPSLSRGVGLILQGTWFVQMGFSFYTNAMAQGCSLVEKSRGNYTVLCEGHMANHRSKAIATLQFNVHLAFLVILIAGVYSIVANKFGLPGEYLNYKPLNADLRQLDQQTQFVLDSDDEAVEEENALKPKEVRLQPKSGVNGFGDH